MYPTCEVRTFVMNKGELVDVHTNRWPHWVIIAAGQVKLLPDGNEILVPKFDGTEPYKMLANVPHGFEAMEDNTVVINVTRLKDMV